MTLRGIDTSNNNLGVPDATISADFVIMKATEGIGYVDNDCNPSYQESKAAGKLLGVYDFAHPDGNNAVDEANYFCDNVAGYVGEAILILDWEHTPTDSVAWAKAWLDQVYRRTGVNAVIYMNTSTANAHDWSSVSANHALWVASYWDMSIDYNYDMSNAGPMPDVNGTFWPNGYAMWQWTSRGHLDGYGGDLDCSVAYMDADGWRAFARNRPVVVTPPVVVPPVVVPPVITPPVVEPPVVTPPVVVPVLPGIPVISEIPVVTPPVAEQPAPPVTPATTNPFEIFITYVVKLIKTILGVK